MSDAELAALAVCQAALGICSDRQFLGPVGYRLPGWFPHLPDQSQYNRRLGVLVWLLARVQQLARCLDSGGVRLSDGTLIGVANYPGCAARSEFAGLPATATRSHRIASSGVCGLCCSPTIAACRSATRSCPAIEKEYEPLADLLAGTSSEIVIADKGLWGRDDEARLAAAGTTLLTPGKTRSAANLGRERALASTRLVIERSSRT